MAGGGGREDRSARRCGCSGDATTMADMIADDPVTRTAMRRVRFLLRCFLGLSLLTLVASVVLRDHPSLVTPSVWVRGTIVAATALLMTVFATRAARGSRRAYLRLRIVTVVAVVAVVAIV